MEKQPSDVGERPDRRISFPNQPCLPADCPGPVANEQHVLNEHRLLQPVRAAEAGFLLSRCFTGTTWLLN